MVTDPKCDNPIEGADGNGKSLVNSEIGNMISFRMTANELLGVIAEWNERK